MEKIATSSDQLQKIAKYLEDTVAYSETLLPFSFNHSYLSQFARANGLILLLILGQSFTAELMGQAPEPAVCQDSLFCSKGTPGMGRSRILSVKFEMLSQFSILSQSNNSTVGNFEGNVNRRRRVEAKLSFPLWYKKNLKIGMGLKFNHEEFKFDYIDTPGNELYSYLHSQSLKSVGMTLGMMKPFKGNFYVAARAGVSVNGDFNKLNLSIHRDYMKFSGSFLLGHKLSEKTEIGMGVSFSQNLGRDAWYPILLFNHTFNKHFGIQALLPAKAHFRYNITPKQLLFAGAALSGANYHITLEESLGNGTKELQFRHSEVRFEVKYEREIWKMLWFGVEGGVRYNLGFSMNELGAPSGNNLIESNVGTSPFLNASIFLVAPKSLRLKKR